MVAGRRRGEDDRKQNTLAPVSEPKSTDKKGRKFFLIF
jgi:hypothetical protein